MPLSWNEIRHRAIKFANEWSGAAREAAEKQTFWNEFFDVFGVSRKAVASFEAPVKKGDDRPRRLHRPVLERQPFPSDRARVEFLFALYEKLTAPLLPGGKPQRAARRKTAD
jgi:hypothetical protein